MQENKDGPIRVYKSINHIPCGLFVKEIFFYLQTAVNPKCLNHVFMNDFTDKTKNTSLVSVSVQEKL